MRGAYPRLAAQTRQTFGWGGGWTPPPFPLICFLVVILMWLFACSFDRRVSLPKPPPWHCESPWASGRPMTLICSLLVPDWGQTLDPQPPQPRPPQLSFFGVNSLLPQSSSIRRTPSGFPTCLHFNFLRWESSFSSAPAPSPLAILHHLCACFRVVKKCP